MDQDRWSTINRIFHAALEVDESERLALVASESKGDLELEAEVALLLQADEDAGSYLESPLIPEGSFSTTTQLAPGDVLCNRFRIVREIAEGGMGHVFEAFDSELAVPIALKVIRPEIAANPEAIGRFRQEVRLARTITHPNICRTFDIERESRIANGQRFELVFFTMEFLRGETLSTYIQRTGPLPLTEVLGIARQVAAALHAAHGLGVIHRDMKPANIMLVASEGSAPEISRVVVTDFGLARLDHLSLSTGLSSFTNTGQPIGTLAYMAPEQLEGTVISPATDIYSFGLILVEMITGKRVFQSNNLLSGIAQRLRGSLSLDQMLAPQVPAQWCRAISDCLHFNPADRLQDANDVIAILGGRRNRRFPQLRSSLAVARRRLPRLAGVFIAFVFTMALSVACFRLYQSWTDSRVAPGALVYLTQVKNQTGDKSLDNITELLQASLSQSIQVNLLDQGRIGDIMQQMTKSPEAAIDDATAREIAMRAGAARVIFATVTSSKGSYTLDVDIQQPDNVPTRYRDHWTKRFSWSIEPTNNSNAIPSALLAQMRAASAWVRHEVGESANDIAHLDAPPQDVTTGNWKALENFTYALQLESKGKRDEAASSLRAAINEDPNFALAYARLGDILVNLGKLNEGYENYLKALDHNNVDRLSLRERKVIQGTYTLDTRDYQAAADAFREYSLLYEHDYLGWFRRGLPLLMLNRPEEAIEALQRAHELDPAATGAIGLLVRAYTVKGDYARAMQLTEELRRHNADDRAILSDGSLHFVQGDFAGATKLLKNMPPSSPAILRMLALEWAADAQAELGQNREAFDLLNQSTEVQPENARPWLDLAALSCQIEAWSRCTDDLHIAIRLEPSPDLLIEASAVLGRALAVAPPEEISSLKSELISLEAHLPQGSYGSIKTIAQARLRGEVLLAAGDISNSLREFGKADALESPLIGREYMGRALAMEAAHSKDPNTARQLRERAIASYEAIALHPAIVWQFPSNFPPGFYANSLQSWLLLAQNTDKNDAVLQSALHQYVAMRSRTPAATIEYLH